MGARTIRSCSAMPEHTCVVCGNTTSKDPSVSFHRFQEVNDTRRARWLRIFGMDESQLKSQSRVCSRHFPNGDSCSESVSTLGKRFASPIKLKLPRAKRAKVRETNKTLATLRNSMQPPVRSSTPVEMPVSEDISLTTPIGEQLEMNYEVHELPSEGDSTSNCPSASCWSTSVHDASSQTAEFLVNDPLLARIESLEAENCCLKASCNSSQPFRIEQIQINDQLVHFYTGFVSYFIFITLFEFLGPVVNKLNY